MRARLDGDGFLALPMILFGCVFKKKEGQTFRSAFSFLLLFPSSMASYLELESYSEDICLKGKKKKKACFTLPKNI